MIAEVTNVLIRLDSTGSFFERFQSYTLDLIILAYAYHCQGDTFRSFDVQLEKAAKKILK